MHFDNGNANTFDTISKRIAIMAVRARVKNYTVAVCLLQNIRKSAFAVALRANDGCTAFHSVLLNLIFQIGKRVRPVKLSLALAKHNHVYTV